MKSAITISLVPAARGGPFVFHDDLAAACASAAELGFEAVEIFPSSAGALDRAELRELCARHRLAIAAIGSGGGWVAHRWHLCHEDPAIRAQAQLFIREIIELAAEFGAPAIVGSMQGRAEGSIDREQALAWLAESLQTLGAHAAAHGQILLYEPLNRYETNLWNRLGEAAAFLDAHTIGPVRLLADLFHMNIEEESLPETFRQIGPRLGHVHFVDSNRRAVGFGHTEVAPVIATLRALGYAGYLSAEALPWPDSLAAARQARVAFLAHA